MKNQTVVFDLDKTLVNNPPGMDPLLSKAASAFPTLDVLMEYIAARKMGYKVIVVTCRSRLWKWRTKRWLKRFGLEPDAIYMRDQFGRDNAAVKSDLIQRAYEDGYRPVLAFEDNESVAEMYRSLGIKTLTPEELLNRRDQDAPVKWEG